MFEDHEQHVRFLETTLEMLKTQARLMSTNFSMQISLQENKSSDADVRDLTQDMMYLQQKAPLLGVIVAQKFLTEFPDDLLDRTPDQIISIFEKRLAVLENQDIAGTGGKEEESSDENDGDSESRSPTQKLGFRV